MELPPNVKEVFWARAAALALMVSVAALPVIEVAELPVVMLMPLSPASAVVILRVPLSAVALISPTRLVTTWLELPLNVKEVFWARAAALVVT